VKVRSPQGKACFSLKPVLQTSIVILAIAVAAPASAVNIVPIFDKSITSLANAATVEADIKQVIATYDTDLTSNVTVEIDFGWGELDGYTVASSDASESEAYIYSGYTYTQMVTALQKAAAANPTDLPLVSAAATMAAKNPTTVTNFAITDAEAQALGLAPATGAGVDGYVGFSSKLAYSLNPASTPKGEYDFEALAEHEIAEVLGRISAVNSTKPSLATLYDLFRFSAPGVHSFGFYNAAYFSVDGGVTDLETFNNVGGGDRGDWLTTSTTTDAFDATASTGVNMSLSAADLEVLNALGWDATINPGGYISNIAGITQGAMGDIAVPEPATWTAMILGVGLAGAAMRRRRMPTILQAI
jgi:hypothetical protein